MSDKFFFKGRQDARVNHVKSGFDVNANKKPGSKKYPLSLVVTSDSRKQEVEALLAENNLFANIRLDTAEDAVESIAELTQMLEQKVETVVLDKVPSRNDPCSCGSNKKYKKCCG